MTTTINILQAVSASTALVLIGVLIGRWTKKPSPWVGPPMTPVLFRGRSEPPAELVATISGWPPPRDPWGPPSLSDQVHSVWWSPAWDDGKVSTWFEPDPWTRVGA